MTPQQFIQGFPEFEQTSTVLIAQKLNLAAARMGGPDTTVWGAFAASGGPLTQADFAHGYLAAHLIVSSPLGGPTALSTTKSKPGEKTSYLKAFEEIELAMCMGPLVAGVVPAAPVGLSLPPALTTGSGTVSLTNGSPTVTFSTPQTLAAGTLLVFMTQPGVYYALLSNVVASTSGTLSAAYGGPTGSGIAWSF